MNKKDVEKRINELVEKTTYYAKKYYEEDKPEISDFEYDMLMLELRELERQYPEFVKKESYTQHVGGNVKSGFSKVEHEIPLLSMQDIFNLDEIKESNRLLHLDPLKKYLSAIMIFTSFGRSRLVCSLIKYL